MAHQIMDVVSLFKLFDHILVEVRIGAGIGTVILHGHVKQEPGLSAVLLVHRLLGTYRRKVSRYIALTDFANA